MNSAKTLPRSVKKYIRNEKNRIRKEFSDILEQQKLIDDLYKRFLKKP